LSTTTQRWSIVDLRATAETQPRTTISTTTVEEYAEAMRDGAKFPPLEIVSDGTTGWIWDGFHRLGAYQAIGATHVEVNVRIGTKRDAILLAVGANPVHGVPRTNADKQRAVEILLRDPEWSANSDRWIADHARVSDKTVAAARVRLADACGVPQPAERKGRDGHTRKAPTKDRAVKDATERESGGEPLPVDAVLDGGPTREPATLTSTPKRGATYSTPTVRDTAKAALDTIKIAAAKFADADWETFAADVEAELVKRTYG
jgi:hypothetical protein